MGRDGAAVVVVVVVVPAPRRGWPRATGCSGRMEKLKRGGLPDPHPGVVGSSLPLPGLLILSCVPCACVCAWRGVRGSGCVRGWVSLVFTESLASAKEENVGIHQVLDQTLLELNNL